MNLQNARCNNKDSTLHVSDRFSVHYQESSTAYTEIGICHTDYVECLLARSQHNHIQY